MRWWVQGCCTASSTRSTSTSDVPRGSRRGRRRVDQPEAFQVGAVADGDPRRPLPRARRRWRGALRPRRTRPKACCSWRPARWSTVGRGRLVCGVPVVPSPLLETIAAAFSFVPTRVRSPHPTLDQEVARTGLRRFRRRPVGSFCAASGPPARRPCWACRLSRGSGHQRQGRDSGVDQPDVVVGVSKRGCRRGELGCAGGDCAGGEIGRCGGGGRGGDGGATAARHVVV